MSRPKVALVYTAHIKKDSFFGFRLPSLGLERLGAAVEDICDIELFDIRFEPDLIFKITEFCPDIVAVNVKTTVYSSKSYEIAKEIKNRLPKTKIVMGGLHATSCPMEALEHSDLVICGDGEDSFRMIVEGVENSKIPGLVYRHNGEAFKNKPAEPEYNMDRLKPPARHLRKPYYNYSAAGLIKMDLLETSRGCTHACSFCSPASVYPHKYRVHSPEYVFAEIKKLNDMGVKYCMLTDDHFGGDLERVEKICDMVIAAGIKIAFFSFIRPFAGKTELKKKMVAAGFIMLSYGAESPNPEQLLRYKKGFAESHEFIKKVNAEWLEAGACYIGNSYVFGDVRDGVKVLSELGAFARKLNPTYIEPLYSQPFPGTKYREELKKEQRLIPERGWSYFTEGRMLVRHPDVNEEQLKKLRVKMWLDFFSPKKAAGVFRVPLYFRNVLNIPLLSVLKYMKACDYSVFGCILEDKFYRSENLRMVETYFRETIATFEPEEMDMTEHFDEFTDMIGLKFIKKALNGHDILINVTEHEKPLATLDIKIRNEKIMIAKVRTDNKRTISKDNTAVFNFPLFLLKYFMAARKNLVKNIALSTILAHNIFNGFYAKIFGRIISQIFKSLFRK